MEHMRLYPPLDTPIVAFRNRGDLHFEDVTAAWGTGQPGVHHAIALADFDRDGDLDFVVNNLGGAAGIYRNDASAPRVAVKLKGLAPNTQGIGAKVKLNGGAVAIQSQEIISGGRYLSGSEAMVVFAAGTAAREMTLEVSWRSGRRSRITEVKGNRIYEIEEAGAPASSTTNQPSGVAPWFTDVSQLLNHRHHEEPFDDFSRQPLLPFRLSQAGPAVAWFDLDGDGTDELFIGSGRGGVLAGYRANGRGGFEPIAGPSLTSLPDDTAGMAGWCSGSGRRGLLTGLSAYENDSAPSVIRFDLVGGRLVSANFFTNHEAGAAGASALAVADMDGDGDLDVFVGGGAIAGRYPEAAPSRIYRCVGERLELDREQTQQLASVGLVNGAVWSDLDNDGFPELILACEWGPVRVFKNESGKLREATAALGLGKYLGWWRGVTTGDLDGDGRLDIIVANWGLNSPYQASAQSAVEPGSGPLKLFFGDFAGRGTMDLIEAEYDPVLHAMTPRRTFDALAASMPFLREQFSTYKSFAETTVTSLLGQRQASARQVEINTLESMVFFNRGQRFVGAALPHEAQLAPAFAVNVADFDGDGREDVFLSQNFFATQPEMPRLDAGRGLWLRGEGGERLVAVPARESGVEVYGEQRGAALADFDRDGRIDLVVAQNGGQTRLFRNAAARPGLRVRLAGPPGNPAGVGAMLRLRFGERWGAAREIHGGSGYWSQDSVVQILGTPESPTAISVLWPGGKRTTAGIPPQAGEIRVGLDGMISSSLRDRTGNP